MAGTDVIVQERFQPALRKKLQIFPDGARSGFEYLYAPAAQLAQGTGADTADNDCVQAQTIQGSQGLTLPVDMIPVDIADRGSGIGVTVNEYEKRSRSKMIKDRAAHALVGLYGKGYLHGFS